MSSSPPLDTSDSQRLAVTGVPSSSLQKCHAVLKRRLTMGLQVVGLKEAHVLEVM